MGNLKKSHKLFHWKFIGSPVIAFNFDIAQSNQHFIFINIDII